MPRSIAKPKPLISTVILGIIGSILHFLYGWLGQWAPVGLIAAVNESVWEHTKLAFIPLFLYWIILIFKLLKTNHWVQAACGGLSSILTTLFLIPALYYLLLCGFGLESLSLNIGIFFFSLLIGQIIGTNVFKKSNPSPIFAILAILVMIGIFIFYCYITYHPLAFPIFTPPVS